MPALAGPARGYPVSWQQCRVLWGSGLKSGAFLSTWVVVWLWEDLQWEC